ncbi:MAG: alpha/beta hydrolase [Clostridiales bacterium]|nr:alpha/beta hydrolase [Clostridiales bacterium]
MEKILLTKANGHQVPCIAEFPEGLEKLVIVVHGYDSSKESANAANLMRQLPGKGFGVLAYDQPHHGTAQAAEEELTVENCLDSLACVEDYLAERFPETELCYFGSSFGAYITCIYLATRPHRGCKAFLRCAAVNFPELAIDEGADDVELPDLFALYEQAKPEGVAMAFAHGACDSTVKVEAAIAFTDRFGYPLTIFPGEEHTISDFPESPIRVAQLAAELYTR